MSLPTDAILNQIPTWSERRRLLARDPLASIDGFHTMVHVVYKYIFGMRVCPNCPRCNVSGEPCQNMAGSSAEAEGGVFGRVDACLTSIEAQKSTGALHAHSQVFVQCLHQHTTLRHVFEVIRQKGSQIVEDYKAYKAHVSRQVYAKVGEELENRLAEAESKWPEYRDEVGIVCRPQYQNSTPAVHATTEERREESLSWARAFIEEDVQYLQERKQNHVHLLNEDTGERVPLPACRRKDTPFVQAVVGGWR